MMVLRMTVVKMVVTVDGSGSGSEDSVYGSRGEVGSGGSDGENGGVKATMVTLMMMTKKKKEK